MLFLRPLFLFQDNFVFPIRFTRNAVDKMLHNRSNAVKKFEFQNGPRFLVVAKDPQRILTCLWLS